MKHEYDAKAAEYTKMADTMRLLMTTYAKTEQLDKEADDCSAKLAKKTGTEECVKCSLNCLARSDRHFKKYNH